MLRWLLRNTRNSRDHLTPELALRLITPQCPLYVAQPRALPVTDPYWAFYWPGGQGLTRYILDNPSAVAGRRVLDFGCGCGAASVASTLAGAEKITAVDIDAVCFLALWINYRINKVVMNNDLRFCNFNLLAEGASELSARISAEHDVILLGDMLYDTDFGASVSSWLRTCRADSTIYISDPGRHVLKAPGSLQSALKPCASYPLPFSVICENPGFSSVVIYEVDVRKL